MLRLISLDRRARRAAFARDLRAGLAAVPKEIPCRYFYDRQGSLLFEEICRVPEYYLCRAERSILLARAAEIADLLPEAVTVVELGSGSAAKTRLLIDSLLARRRRLRYLPVDICAAVIEETSRDLLASYPGLEITAVAAEYEEGLRRLREEVEEPKVVLWLGSNIGNLHRDEAAQFLRRVSEMLSAADRLLVGIDLRKDRGILERAYDDAAGITARFNLNLLARINRELGGNFDLEDFSHRAVYREEEGRVEMRLYCLRTQRVRIDRFRCEIPFEAGEYVHTENSYKYSLEEIGELSSSAGLRVERQWLDVDRRFSLNLLAPRYVPGMPGDQAPSFP